MNYDQLQNESEFEWKLRLCKAKLNKEIDLDWQEICELLGLDIHCDSLRKMAYGYQEYDNYIHSLNGVSTRILAISDLHIPFNIDIETFREYSNRVDVLVLNGDIQDCQSCSKWSKKYRVNVTEEMILARQFMIDLINMIKPKQVIIVKGNHEMRMGRYLSDKLNEDIMNLMPDSPMDLIINDGFKNRDRFKGTETWYEPLVDVFKDENICISYTGEWYRKVGKTIFAHPLSYSSGMLKTTEKAVEYFLRKDRDFDSIVLAHTHKLGSYVQGQINMYEQGCCAKTELLDYADGYLTLPAQKGFIYVCQNANGELIVDKTKLVKID
jgi:predicted phosphodiesterase